MAASGRGTASPAPKGWADLPAELLKVALAGAHEIPEPPRRDMWGRELQQTLPEDTPLILADVLHAAATCRSWHRSLNQSPTLGNLTVGAGPAGKQAWMERAGPGARCLRLYCSAAGRQGQAMLHVLNAGATFEVEVGHAPSCLPSPTRLANLRSLTASTLDWDPSWLRALGTLPLLASLQLSIAKPKPSPAPPPIATGLLALPAGSTALAGHTVMVLPRLPVLVEFKAHIEPGCPPLQLHLEQLPKLEEVELWGSCAREEGDRGTAELLAATPAAAGTGGSSAAPLAATAAAAASPAGGPSRLRRLSVDLSRATLDFAAMPALARADIWAAHLAGSASLTAATALSRLTLGSSSADAFDMNAEFALDKPWLAAALRALPPTLSTLRLRGTFFSAEVAAALASTPSLRALSLHLDFQDEGLYEEEDEITELGPGPLWGSLSALRWSSWQCLPQAAASAERLEVLHWVGTWRMPTRDYVTLLAGLPALRHLLLAVRGSPPDDLEQELRQALPRLSSLTLGSMGEARSEAEFWEAAAAAGGDPSAASQPTGSGVPAALQAGGGAPVASGP